ncbi:MAG: metallophosphoesterase [Gammaproteobacteria bacterium]|nr:metallophosphoesterase [Gammaproteobacteria bacterium]
MFIVRLIVLSLMVSAAGAKSPARELGPHRWTEIPRIVAFGDVHGAYHQMVTALKATRVIDDALNWSGGDTHLVSLGDLLDRGSDSRRVLDLLIALQSEAHEAGGRVHVVIGNHELMNLTGDMRYVADAEFAAFAAEETDQMRDAAFAKYRQRANLDAPDASADESTVRREFNERFPSGYFTHRAHFSTRGSYGSWLLGQPLMVVLNETVFVHGGLPPIAVRMSLQQINSTFTSDLAEIMSLGQQLALAGWVRSDEDLLLQDNMVVAELERAGATGDPALVAAGNRFVSLVGGELFGNASPNWYRGTARCHQTLERPLLAAALINLGARRVVVGHTPTSTARVQQRMDGRALLADTGMLTSYYGGQPAPLVFTGDDLKILYPLQEESSDHAEYLHPLQINGMAPDSLETLLRTGLISSLGDRTGISHSGSVTIQLNGNSINAIFERGSNQNNQHKIAAYRLSRLLKLDLVPVTVERAVNGRKGVLIALPEHTLSEMARTTTDVARSNSCGIGNDYQLMYAFDALIHNEQRSAETMIYDQQNWQLYLTGHGSSFGTGGGLPSYLAGIEKVLPGSLAADLRIIDEEKLTDTLGELLSKRQLRTLLKRREQLLRTWKTTTP